MERAVRRRAAGLVLVAAFAAAAASLLGGNSGGEPPDSAPNTARVTTDRATQTSIDLRHPDAGKRVLEFARLAPDRWNSAEGRALAGGTAITFALLADQETFRVGFGDHHVTHVADGLRTEYDTRRRLAEISKREAPVPGKIPPGARTLEESPTNIDMLNLALAPSYWLRKMVDPRVESVSVAGLETVIGRPAWHVNITFKPEHRGGYGDRPWQWWVDEATGILLRTELPIAGGVPAAFEMKELRVDSPVNTDYLIPADTEIRVLVSAEKRREVSFRSDAPISPKTAYARASKQP